MNRYEKMEIVSFEDIYDVFTSIMLKLDCMDSDAGMDYITMYGKRKLIKDLFSLMIKDGLSIGYINFDCVDIFMEDETYLLLINTNKEISIEPAYSDSGNIIKHCAKASMLYMDDCKQDIIEYCLDNCEDVILFDFADEYDHYIDNMSKEDSNEFSVNSDKDEYASASTYVSKSKDGIPLGFCKTWSNEEDGVYYHSSYSHYSSDIDSLKETAQKFGVNL